MTKPAIEEEILALFVGEMESLGEKRKLVRLDIDESMLEKINEAQGASLDLNQLYRYADRCFANEWLEHTIMGAGKYGCLSITAKGLGVVRSRQRKEETLANRSRLKKASDVIEDHKGIFAACPCRLVH